MTQRAVVLGSGPAGMFAAEACGQRGYDVTIVSDSAGPSPLHGAQFLQRPIPGITSNEPTSFVMIDKWGTPDRYASKVYGQPTRDTSWHDYGRDVQAAWDMRTVYHHAWEKWRNRVVVDKLTGEKLQRYIDVDPPDLMVNSIPLKFLCFTFNKLQHEVSAYCVFHKQDVIIAADCYHNEGDNVIVYNGKDEPSWYRSASIFGKGSTEWGVHQKTPPLPENEAIRVGKPLSTTCNCWPNLLHVGRYGRWQKGVLAHDGFYRVMNHAMHSV